MAVVSEKDVEGYLRDEVLKRGWEIRKNISDVIKGGTPGTPDDTIILPGREVAWVECKSPKAYPLYIRHRLAYYKDGATRGCSRTDIRQFDEQRRLFTLGQFVTTVGVYEHVDSLMDYLETYYDGGIVDT